MLSPPSYRYKQFDWFHDRLTEKFPCFIIPPLPEKAVVGTIPVFGIYCELLGIPLLASVSQSNVVK